MTAREKAGIVLLGLICVVSVVASAWFYIQSFGVTWVSVFLLLGGVAIGVARFMKDRL